MIFDYNKNKFINDGRSNILAILGIKIANAFPIEPIVFEPLREAHTPADITLSIIEDIVFTIENNRLKISCKNNNTTMMDIIKFFIDDRESVSKSIFPYKTKKCIQEAIDLMANKFELLHNVNYKVFHFNDRLLLYMYPILRDLCGQDTNFRKLFHEIAIHCGNSIDFNYNIHKSLCSDSLKESIQKSCGGYSKSIMKWMVNGLVEQYDITNEYSFLDNAMANKLLNNQIEGKVNLQYKNILLPDRLKMLCFYKDVFDGNIGFINKAIMENIKTLPIDRDISKFLKENFSKNKIIKLLKENYESKNSMFLSDTARQCNTYSDPQSIPPKLKAKYPNGLEIPKFKTLKELHDKISAQYNEIKTEESNRPFEFTEEEWKLHEYKIGNVETILPSEASVVVDWGKQLKHCIASYTEGMARKDYLLLGVKINGKLLYTLQVEIYPPVKSGEKDVIRKRFSIRQFSGYKNCNPENKGDDLVRKTVDKILQNVFILKGNLNNLDSAI